MEEIRLGNLLGEHKIVYFWPILDIQMSSQYQLLELAIPHELMKREYPFRMQIRIIFFAIQ